MPTIANLVVGVVVFAVFTLMTVGGAMFLRRGAGQAIAAWRLRTGRPTAAGDVAVGGWAMVRGTVRPEDEPVVAPLSGRDVVCARSRLEHLAASGNTTHWEPGYETTTATGFRVADGTGAVRVDPVEPSIETGGDRTVVRQPLSPEAATDRVRAFAADAPDHDDVPAGDGVRYVESFVAPNDAVLVYGRVGTDQGRPTFGAGNDLTITTESRSETVRDTALTAFKQLLLGGFLLAIPTLFVVTFLVPYYFGG